MLSTLKDIHSALEFIKFNSYKEFKKIFPNFNNFGETYYWNNDFWKPLIAVFNEKENKFHYNAEKMGVYYEGK